MANSKTVNFPIEISHTGADNSVEVLSFNLTLSLSLEPGAENSACGEITINGAENSTGGETTPYGAVPPVDDHPPVYQQGGQVGDETPLEAGGTVQGDDSMQKAA